MIKRRKKQKPRKTRSNKAIDKLLLKQWADTIKQRDNYTCQICKKNLKNNPKAINAHHILPKSIKELRYNMLNGITLCSYCHIYGSYSAHTNALYFAYWLKINKPLQYNKLMNILLTILSFK